MPYYTGGPAGPLVLTIAVQAEAGPLPLPQDGAEVSVPESMPDTELPAVEDQSVPPAHQEASGELEPTSPASLESESATAVDVSSLPEEGATLAHQIAPLVEMARSATPPAIRPDAMVAAKPAKPGPPRRFVLLGLAGLVIVALASGIAWFTIHPTSLTASIQASPTASTPAAPVLSSAEFTLPTGSSGADKITPGPDGNLWFTEYDSGLIGRVTPDGSITEFLLPSADNQPYGITAWPDGNLWFTEEVNNLQPTISHPNGLIGTKIGRITPSGKITEFSLPSAYSHPEMITAGRDGNLWFTEWGSGKIGRISLNGTITEFSLPSTYGGPTGITSGPDGNLWFTEVHTNKIGRISPVK